MEDPTTSVKPSRRILAGDDIQWFEEDLEKWSQRWLEASENPPYFILTINMNGPTMGTGTAEKRRKLLRNILRPRFKYSIIFCQELPGKFKKVVPKDYEFIANKKQAAVIWHCQDFDGSSEGLKTTDTKIKELMKKEEGENSSANGVLSRISMVRLRPKQNLKAASILAVSYHAPHKMETKKKHIACRILLSFLAAVLEQEAISSYIIGGDFNFNTLSFELPNDVTVPSFEMSPRAEEKHEKSSNFKPHKDNFMYFPKVLKVRGIRTILFEDNNVDKNSDLTEEDHKKVHEGMSKKGTKADKPTDMLDHDPVVGVLVLPSPSKAVKNLSEEFKGMSLSGCSEGEKAHPATEKLTGLDLDRQQVPSNTMDQDRVVVEFPSPTAEGKITVLQLDLDTLVDRRYLNSCIVDFYMLYLITNETNQNLENSHIFRSFFYTSLTETGNVGDEVVPLSDEQRYKKASPYTRNVNLFEKNFIFIPICRSNHWLLALIYNLPSLIDNGGKIFMIDSTFSDSGRDSFSSLSSRGQEAEVIRSFISYEWKEKRGSPPPEISDRTLQLVYPKVPQQENGYDCGVFVLLFFKEFLKRMFPVDDLSLEKALSWYNQSNVLPLREEITSILRQLDSNAHVLE